jgi:hypothetical protein
MTSNPSYIGRLRKIGSSHGVLVVTQIFFDCNELRVRFPHRELLTARLASHVTVYCM